MGWSGRSWRSALGLGWIRRLTACRAFRSTRDHSHCDIPQPWPQQFVAPQRSCTGQAFLEVAWVWAAGTLNCLVSLLRPQEGHTGFSSARTSHSNWWPQSRQAYS